MVENIYRQLALRHGTQYSIARGDRRGGGRGRPADRLRHRRHRRRLPADLRALGTVGRLFTPMADTMIYALIGSLLLTLTLLPVLCAWRCAAASASGATRSSSGSRAAYAQGLDWSLRHARADDRRVGRSSCGALAAARSRHRRRVHAAPRRGGALGSRHHAVHDLVRGIGEDRARRSAAILRSFPEVTDVASEHGRPDDGTDPTGFFNCRVLRRAQALLRSGRARTTPRRS